MQKEKLKQICLGSRVYYIILISLYIGLQSLAIVLFPGISRRHLLRCGVRQGNRIRGLFVS
jgi:hypothetical protein